MAIAWILCGFFIFVTAIFVGLAVFFPEWVGITGKKAREAMKQHQADQPSSETAKNYPKERVED